jgi:ceramide glucosyltransferase
MIAILVPVLAWTCLGLVVTTVLHACVVAAVLNLRRAEEEGSSTLANEASPPITWFRPVKSGVPNLEKKLKSFLTGIRPGDQVIFGVDPGSKEEKSCSSLRTPDPYGIVVVSCRPDVAPNPKISKLIQMEPHARHGNWVVMDAEAKADFAFLEAFRSEWAGSGADALTAGYWFEGGATLPQRLDSLAVLMTLWPGLELIRTFGRFRLTLGACTAFRREDIEKLGGWAAVGNLLAEDNELGKRVAAMGKSVRLSQTSLILDSDPMSLREYWHHQLRVAVTYRVADPLGAAGLIFTRGISASALLLLIEPGAGSLVFFLAAWGARVALGVRVARQLRIHVPGLLWTVPLADFVETACWGANWFMKSVRWGGRRRAISFRGRLSGA